MWLAIGLTLFMSFAAMAVDIGIWYAERTEVQTAADSAALAGAALLPGDPVQAADQARLVARQHGYRNDEVTVNIIDGSLIEVSIQAEVDNYFLPAIGFDDTQLIGTKAVAEYEGQVNMGSPENIIGNDPESAGTQPDFTMGVEGPGYTKINGDRFLPKNCGGSAVSNCVAGATAPRTPSSTRTGTSSPSRSRPPTARISCSRSSTRPTSPATPSGLPAASTSTGSASTSTRTRISARR